VCLARGLNRNHIERNTVPRFWESFYDKFKLLLQYTVHSVQQSLVLGLNYNQIEKDSVPRFREAFYDRFHMLLNCTGLSGTGQNKIRLKGTVS